MSRVPLELWDIMFVLLNAFNVLVLTWFVWILSPFSFLFDHTWWVLILGRIWNSFLNLSFWPPGQNSLKRTWVVSYCGPSGKPHAVSVISVRLAELVLTPQGWGVSRPVRQTWRLPLNTKEAAPHPFPGLERAIYLTCFGCLIPKAFSCQRMISRVWI